MTRFEPISPSVRLAITHWPDDSPWGAVTTFCVDHAISRKSFYAIRRRALEDGAVAALEPRSRRPRSSPSRTPPDLAEQALQIRAALERDGLDHGPVSVGDKMRSLGMDAPSRATLARIFHAAGVVLPEPRKRPRSAYRRFVYPAPNCLWQMDAAEYVLTGGRKCVIFQIIDDHSRYAVASLAASGETSEAAIRVVQQGIAACGVPQKFLTDNGVALNPTRRGYSGQLVDYLGSLGVVPITGKPGKPTTQGKNERFHRTLFRWLDKQPLADSLDQLQEMLTRFDHLYNTERPHQALPGRITPQQAWHATAKAEPPRPKAADITQTVPADIEGEAVRIANINGVVRVHATHYKLAKHYAGRSIWVIWTLTEITFFDDHGTQIISHPRPPKGTTYVGNGKTPGTRHHTTVTKVPRQETSPMS
jgi:transposase InsO family protein